MTEKRFTIEIWQEGSLFYKDDKEGFSTHNSTSYVTNLVKNKLNELADENEQLKQRISEQGTQIDFLKDENKHMRDTLQENKQLKQSEQEFREYCNYLKSVLEDNEIWYE
jgi:regulator of replication initiation timing